MLHIEGSERRTRLSFVFRDDEGMPIGVTSAALAMSGPSSPTAFDLSVGRPRVLVGDVVVGRLNPDQGGNAVDSQEQGRSRSGKLISTFLIHRDAEISPSFSPPPCGQVASFEAVAGADVKIFGEDAYVGIVQNLLEFMQIDHGIVYPLLRIERSGEDLAVIDPGVRNGAMIVSQSGALVGIVVALSKDQRFYSVAPISDVLAWHGLNFFGSDEDVAEYRGSAHAWIDNANHLPEVDSGDLQDLAA